MTQVIKSSLPSGLPHSPEQSSTSYTVGPCWLSVLNSSVRVLPKLPVYNVGGESIHVDGRPSPFVPHLKLSQHH